MDWIAGVSREHMLGLESQNLGLESVSYSPYGAWPLWGTSVWLFLAQKRQQNEELCFNVAVTCLPGGHPKGT